MRYRMCFVTSLGALTLVAAVSGQVSAQILTTLCSFNGSDGALPFADLTVSGNTLYGTTRNGGANGYGEVFSLPTSGGTPTVLASFNDSDGDGPRCDLKLIGGALYGTTEGGGAFGFGTVFSVPVGGGTPTVLASFNGYNGSEPYAGLAVSGNTLYGTTPAGGQGFDGTTSYSGYGTVFSVPVSGGSLTVLAAFNDSNGDQPYGGLAVGGNTLYGATIGGGDNGYGVVYSVPLSGGGPTLLASFALHRHHLGYMGPFDT